MNAQLAYVFTIDTHILQNSNEKITEIFIAKYKEGIMYHFGPDIERFQSCFEAALFAIGEWQIKVDAMTRYREEDEVMEFFSSIPSDEARNLATSILLFSDVLAMKGVDEVFAYFLGKDDVV
ncbi:TPA: hypothetical protein ACGQLW_003903 [Escherichia coli]